MTEDSENNFPTDNFMFVAPANYQQPKISKRKVLNIVSQSYHIIISQKITDKQREMLIENCSKLIYFVEKDHYTSIFPRLFK